MRRLFLLAPTVLLLASCGDRDAPPSWYYRTPPDAEVETGADGGDASTQPDATETGDAGDATAEAAPDAEPDAPTLTSCDFGYDSTFVYSAVVPLPSPPWQPQQVTSGDGPSEIAHAEPPPPSTSVLKGWRDVDPSDLVMPNYQDDMPLFERAGAWAEPTRCFETPGGVHLLTEEQAYDMYRDIAEKTTGVVMNTSPEFRSVVGLRGSYPGQIAWHGNLPDHFNDTLVLLYIEQDGSKHVREFPVNTDTGNHNFGIDSSSSLRPNRRYHYVNSWHNSYNALHIDESGYHVQDDGNTNGHWDSDRNGWLPPAGNNDRDRVGSGHNIHMGSLNAPLGTALVDVWSAGCQVIPGTANWTEFITHAWTQLNDKVDYFLIDTRDIPSDVWAPCTPDGSHACPYRIDSLPFSDSRDTSAQGAAEFGTYNCSDADESGPEVVYVLNIDTMGTLTVSVDCQDPVDIDVHLLDGDDANACLERGHMTFDYEITPGRYLIIADSFAEGGTVYSGAYTLNVSLN
jgi:hypothetical protein